MVLASIMWIPTQCLIFVVIKISLNFLLINESLISNQITPWHYSVQSYHGQICAPLMIDFASCWIFSHWFWRWHFPVLHPAGRLSENLEDWCDCLHGDRNLTSAFASQMDDGRLASCDLGLRWWRPVLDHCPWRTAWPRSGQGWASCWTTPPCRGLGVTSGRSLRGVWRGRCRTSRCQSPCRLSGRGASGRGGAATCGRCTGSWGSRPGGRGWSSGVSSSWHWHWQNIHNSEYSGQSCFQHSHNYPWQSDDQITLQRSRIKYLIRICKLYIENNEEKINKKHC